MFVVTLLYNESCNCAKDLDEVTGAQIFPRVIEIFGNAGLYLERMQGTEPATTPSRGGRFQRRACLYLTFRVVYPHAVGDMIVALARHVGPQQTIKVGSSQRKYFVLGSAGATFENIPSIQKISIVDAPLVVRRSMLVVALHKNRNARKTDASPFVEIAYFVPHPYGGEPVWVSSCVTRAALEMALETA